MAVVIGLMYVAARVMKNRQMPGSGGLKLGGGNAAKRQPLQVLARQSIGRHNAVTIVRAGDKALVLGITETNISLLAELNEIDLAQSQELMESQGTSTPIDATASLSARTGLLSQIRERTVRR